MSNIGPMSRQQQSRVPTPPRGDTIARYSTYLEAQRAVDYLSDNHFPVQFVTIVGTGLRMVERVTGRLNYPRVALAGALSGAWFGLFVGLLLSIFGTGVPTGAVLAAIIVGAGFGMLFGIISYALTGGRRDFTSTSQIVASEYEVLCMPEQAGAARELLGRLASEGGPRSAPQAQVPPPGSPGGPFGGPATGQGPSYGTPPPSGPYGGGPYGAPPPGQGYPPPPPPPPPPGGGSTAWAPGQQGQPGGSGPASGQPGPAAAGPGQPGPAVPPEQMPPPVTGPTYGEMIERQRRERLEREQAERQQAERERLAREEAERARTAQESSPSRPTPPE